VWKQNQNLSLCLYHLTLGKAVWFMYRGWSKIVG